MHCIGSLFQASARCVQGPTCSSSREPVGCASACSPKQLAPLSRCVLRPGFATHSWKSRQHIARLHKQRATQAGRVVCLSSPTGEADVVCVGEALYDCLAEQRGVPKEEVTDWVPYPGGAPANVAAALGKLGARVAFVSALGDDDLGDEMCVLLAGRNVNLSSVQRISRPTRDVLVTRTADGERTFAGFGKAATTEYADCFIDPDKLPEATIRNATVVVTGTLGLAYPSTHKALTKAVQIAHSGSAQVLVDVNWRPVFWQDDEAEALSFIKAYVLKADIVKVTDEEAEWLLEVPAADALRQPERVLEQLPKAKGVLVTAGGLGAAYAFRSANGSGVASGHVPVMRVAIMDTTGAGDAFTAGFLHSLLMAGGVGALQADPEKLNNAVRFAAACGAYTIQGPGAIEPQPSLQQVEELLETASFAKAAL